MIEWKREVTELANLALARFTDLNQSELKVLVAVTTGEIAFCGPHPLENDPHNYPDPYNNPDFAAFWGLERDVRAELIRWLCVNSDAAACVDARGLRIHAARISGQLDLSFAMVRIPLGMFRCRIADTMNLRFAQIEFLQLAGSLVPGLAADGMRVRGTVSLGNRFRSVGEVRLVGANIGWDLNCIGGKFVKPDGHALNADKIKVGGSVFLRNGFSAQGGVRLLDADIGGSLECDGGKFVNPDGQALNADGLKVAGSVFLQNGFIAQGEVRLLGADIGGTLGCNNGKFVNPQGNALNANGAKVAGSVFLRNGFGAEGEVDLLGASIAGDLDCENGKFVKPDGYALSADGVKVGHAVFLRNRFIVQGVVRLIGADIGGNLEISRAEFAVGSHLIAGGAIVKGGFFWRDLGANVKAALDLRHASVGPIFDDQASWPTTGNLNLDGFTYARVADGPTDAETRLDWLTRQPADPFRPQPYQQLAKVLREAGDNVGARRVLIAMENSRRKHGNLNSLSWLWRWVLRLTIGYGYRPWLALCCGVGIVMFGFFLFGHGYYEGAITPSDKDAFSTFEVHHPKLRHGNPPPYYPRFSPLVYSLDTFLPIISFGQKDHWMPNPNTGRWGYWLRAYQWIFHVGLGWVLTTLFVAGLTPIVRSG